MLRLGVALSALLIVGACAATPISRSDIAQVSPQVTCLGVPAPVCDPVRDATLAAVASSGRIPVKVWVNTGILCPRADCLFDPMQNFPYPMPPEGGEWVANVEIAFAGSALHAGLQVAKVGQAYVPVLIGYREPLPGWCSGACP
jgi:hypothetical protein